MSGAGGVAGGAGAGRTQGGPGPVPPGAHDAGATSVMPPVAGDQPPATGAPQAPRRRQGGANGQQAQQARQAAGTPAAAPAAGRDGYSTPTTYAKGQPTPPRGTQVPAAAATAQPRTAPGPAAPSGRTRRARLRIARTDPWSVMKVSFLLSIALGVVTIVGVSLLWMVLDAAGVFSSLGGTLTQATANGGDSGGGFSLEDYLSFGNVLMFTSLVAVIDVVLLTALATLAAFIYNTAAGMTGGVELTLAEED